MPKYRLESFYYIQKFQQHDLVKDKLLDLLDYTDFEPCIDHGCGTNITKTDWADAENFQRPWVQFLNSYLLDEVLEIYKKCGYDGFTLHEIWFQQYLKNSAHGWHTHSSNFTAVYYTELFEDSPKTQLINPFDQKTVIEVEINEGDILIFPSFVLHRAPPNLSKNRKTIVSFNTNATYSNNIYGKGIQ